MLPRDYAGQDCSVARALEVVGERWTLLIVRDALTGVTRFEGFQRRLGLAPNMLSKRLRALTDAGVLERRPYQERPERHEYVLTDAGRGLFPAVMGLMRWGDEHRSLRAAPVEVLHRSCGGVIDAHAICARCGLAVGADEVEWHEGRPRAVRHRPRSRSGGAS